MTLSRVEGPVSLEKLAYDAIKEAILNFQLKPGDALVESELGRQLGISKTPVRDALSRLEKEGFIEKIPFKGATVTGITQVQVMEIFEVRAVLEGLAAHLAVPFLTDDDVIRAEELLKQQEEALRRKDYKLANTFNRAFHEILLVKCPNNQLKYILGNLEDHLRRFRTLSFYLRAGASTSVAEHREILAGMRMRDELKTEAAMRSHLLKVMEDLECTNFDELINQAFEKAKAGEGF